MEFTLRVIIAGGRTFSPEFVETFYNGIMESGFNISTVICGMAQGADTMGRVWAFKSTIPVKEFPAQWKLHGKAAGFKRNIEMAQNADALIAFWDGESRGTKHMIDIATKMGLKVFVKRY